MRIFYRVHVHVLEFGGCQSSAVVVELYMEFRSDLRRKEWEKEMRRRGNGASGGSASALVSGTASSTAVHFLRIDLHKSTNVSTQGEYIPGSFLLC